MIGAARAGFLGAAGTEAWTGPDEEYYVDASGNNVLYCNFDTLADLFTLSGNASLGTTNANTSLGCENALQLDGTGDYATTDANYNFKLEADGSCCHEVWVRTGITLSGSPSYGILEMDGGSNIDWTLVHRGTGTGQLRHSWNSSSSPPGAVSQGIAAVANTWTHIAYARNDAGNIRMWRQGVSVATATNALVRGSDSAPLVVGASSAIWGGNAWNGQIGPVRIVKGASVYDPTSSTITVPTAKFSHVSDFG
jgi:hypothetical protein